MTQHFHADPIRLGQREVRVIMARLVAPFVNGWSLKKALLRGLLIAVAAILVFVCLALWSLNQPWSRIALPDNVSQIRLSFVGSMGQSQKRLVSQEILLIGNDARTIAALANKALTRKSWHQVIRGASNCELQFMFLDSNASVRRILSVTQEDGGLVVYDNKWRRPLQGMDSDQFFAMVPQSRLSAMRGEACGN